MTDPNIFDNISVLIDSMTDQLTRGQDRLENSQVDLYGKLEKLRADLSELGTQQAIAGERVSMFAERLERIAEKLHGNEKLSNVAMEALLARIELMDKWIEIQKQRQIDAEKAETKEFRDKVIAFLSKAGALLGAGAAGGGLVKALTTLLGG